MPAQYREPPPTVENDHEAPWMDLGHLEIPRSSVEGREALEVFEVICRALADATKSSLADINSPDEVGYVVAHYERTALPFVSEWAGTKLPAPIGPFPYLALESSKIAVMLLSACGPLRVDRKVRAGKEIPVCAERFWMDCHAWLQASEEWAALSFAKSKLNRTLPADRMKLNFSGKTLARVDFLFDNVSINPAIPPQHVPDTSRFHEGISPEILNDAMSAVLRSAYGVELYPLRALFTIIRENQAAKGLAGEISLFDPANLAKRIQELHREEARPELQACVDFVNRAEQYWLDEARKYRDSSFKNCWLKHTPRALATVPAMDVEKRSTLLCSTASDLTLYQIGHDAIRGRTHLEGEVAEVRRKLLAAGSKHIAWHELALCGIPRPDDNNKSFGPRYACYVAEEKQLGGIEFPAPLVDFDLIVFDRQRKQISVCECKYASAALRATEFREEFDEFGPNGKYWAEQLTPRLDWVREHQKEMSVDGWSESLADWRVEGCILTNIAPRSLLAAFGDLPGVRTLGSKAAREFLFGG